MWIVCARGNPIHKKTPKTKQNLGGRLLLLQHEVICSIQARREQVDTARNVRQPFGLLSCDGRAFFPRLPRLPSVVRLTVAVSCVAVSVAVRVAVHRCWSLPQPGLNLDQHVCCAHGRYSSDKVRNRGATAVVGSKIYLLGGITQAGQVVDQVRRSTLCVRFWLGPALSWYRPLQAAHPFIHPHALFPTLLPAISPSLPHSPPFRARSYILPLAPIHFLSLPRSFLLSFLSFLSSPRSFSGQVDVLDTSSGRWAQGTAMKSARGNHAAASFGGKIFVFGTCT